MPQHKRGPWSQHEDSILLQLVNQYGAHNWVRISQTIQTRSPKQCRERFHQNLKPNLNHEPISPEEGVLIEQMVAEMGKRWAEIARRLRGRSDNAVKNWWNGSMNRRRRTTNHRRSELEAQPTHHDYVQAPSLRLPTAQYSLPSNFPAQFAAHYYGQPMYQPSHAQMQQQVRVPSNGPLLRSHGLVETPLPSPSAFSQMSGEAPSLVSDTSSTSTRSPHNGTSPIELPPLSGSRSERRQSATHMLQLGVPGSFVQDNDYHMSGMQMARLGEEKLLPRVLQEPFMPQQQWMQSTHCLPSQPRHPSPLQMQSAAPQHSYHMPPQRVNSYPQHLMPHVPAQSPNVQLPSISNLPSPASGVQNEIDPALSQVRYTPVPSAPTPEGSPKDKMSLSNLI